MQKRPVAGPQSEAPCEPTFGAARREPVVGRHQGQGFACAARRGHRFVAVDVASQGLSVWKPLGKAVGFLEGELW